MVWVAGISLSSRSNSSRPAIQSSSTRSAGLVVKQLQSIPSPDGASRMRDVVRLQQLGQHRQQFRIVADQQNLRCRLVHDDD